MPLCCAVDHTMPAGLWAALKTALWVRSFPGEVPGSDLKPPCGVGNAVISPEHRCGCQGIAEQLV